MTIKIYKQSEEDRRKKSVAAKKRWADSSKRKEHSKKMKQHFAKNGHHRTGSKHSEVTKNKMRDAANVRWSDPEERTKASKREMDPEKRKRTSELSKQRWKSPDYRAKMSNKIIIMSVEGRKRLSEFNKKRWKNPKYRKSMSGENNPAWKGGISKEEYGDGFDFEFKEYIRSRQIFICADNDNTCVYLEEALCVHHIDEDKNNSIPENCIALCKSHHARSHNNEARIRHYNFLLALEVLDDTYLPLLKFL